MTGIPLKHGTGQMPALGFGTLIPDKAVTINATRDALEAGFRHFDCAERYGNDREVGKALQSDIRPLFTQRDIDGMKKGFNLESYDEVKAHAAAIYDRIRGIGGAVMPPPPPRGEGPWPHSRIELFAKWMADGFPS